MCFYCYDCGNVHKCDNPTLHGIGIGYCQGYHK